MVRFIEEIKQETKSFFKEIKKDFSNLTRKKQIEDKPEKTAEVWSYLPYDKYDMAKGIFYNKNGIGFVYKVSHFSGIGIE